MDDFHHLTFTEAVRRRPGFYIGGIDARAVHYMIELVLANMLDLASEKESVSISLILRQDGIVVVSDNGPGIPAGYDEKSGINHLEDVFTQKSHKGLFAYRDRPVGDSLRVGPVYKTDFAVINVLSETLLLESRHNGQVFNQSYKQGTATSPVESGRALGVGESNGLTICFKPDPSIFVDVEIKAEMVKRRLGELAALYPGTTFLFRDERLEPVDESVFHTERGVAAYLSELNRNVQPLHEVISDSVCLECVAANNGKPYRLEMDLALQFVDGSDAEIRVYVNTSRDYDSKPVIRALSSAVVRAISSYHPSSFEHPRVDETNLIRTPDGLPIGLTGVISLWHPDPIFRSQVTGGLSNDEVEFALAPAFFNAMAAFKRADPDGLKRILAHISK